MRTVTEYECHDCDRGVREIPCHISITNGDDLNDLTYCIATGETNDAHFKKQ